MKQDEFINLLTKLEITEFIGVARILCIPLCDKDNTPIPFENLFTQMVQKFSILGRKQRRELLKVLRASQKVKSESLNGT